MYKHTNARILTAGKVTRSTSTPPEAAVYASVQRAQDTVDTHAFNNSSSMPLPADDRQLYPPLASQYYSHPPFRANNDGIQAMPTPTLLGDVHGRSPSPLEKDPLPQSQNSDHITPEHLRQSFKQDNAEDADPRSPSSVAAGVFSTGSSPVYITPHHHQQPMYAYHSKSIHSSCELQSLKYKRGTEDVLLSPVTCSAC